MRTILEEFKEFALRGNVVDMAVGIIIGAAFSTIVQSLVKDVIMPPIGLVTGGVDFSNIYIPLSSAHYDSLAQAKEAGAPIMNIGVFFNAVISFVIVVCLVPGDQDHEHVAPQAGGGAADGAAALARGATPAGDPRRFAEARLGFPATLPVVAHAGPDADALGLVGERVIDLGEYRGVGNGVVEDGKPESVDGGV